MEANIQLTSLEQIKQAIMYGLTGSVALTTNLSFQNGKVGESYVKSIKFKQPIIVNGHNFTDDLIFTIDKLDDLGLSLRNKQRAVNNVASAPQDSQVVNNATSTPTPSPTQDKDDSKDPNATTAITDVIGAGMTAGFVTPTAPLNNDGLIYAQGFEELEIYGTPQKQGDFTCQLRCCLKNQSLRSPNVLTFPIKISVLPDPRSLWKNLPTPPDIEYFKPDTDKAFIALPNGRFVVAASKRGRSHAHEAKPRDDDFKLVSLDNGWCILVVADGAGSAKYSRKGSQIACTEMVKFCTNELNTGKLENFILAAKNSGYEQERKVYSSKFMETLQTLLVRGAYTAHKEIEKVATAHNDSIKDYSTTLLASIVKKFDFGWFVANFAIGDGSICVYDANIPKHYLGSTPDSGEYAGQTRFLTMQSLFKDASIYARVNYKFYDHFTALMLMTDGVSDPYFETDANLENIEKWQSLWSEITTKVEMFNPDHQKTADELLNWLDFWSVGNHDDRTIAILY